MKIKNKFYTWLLLLLCTYSYGQMCEYNYKRELKGISEQWHNVILPNSIFGKVSPNLSDIRIFGVTANNDTIEAPYSIRQSVDKISVKEVPFKTLNTSHNSTGYYYTFEIPTTETINKINLDFTLQNFDWRLKLEGSQNNQEWFTIVDNYRILSIKNSVTDFNFTTLAFPNSKYRFFRLLIYSSKNPALTFANVTQNKITNGKYRNYKIKKIKSKENKQYKQTEIDIDLQMPVPVCYLNMYIANGFDYCRPITIKYLADSFKTEQGWKYNYGTLTSETLTSIKANEFKFNSTTTQHLKIIIQNQNNQALNVDSIVVKGYVHELAARFTMPATYFLTYGNAKALKPHYDIEQFANKIPTKLSTVEMGDELRIKKEKVEEAKPLFSNKNWLWIIMTGMILLLGGFSVKMMRKK